jgi:putative membrane protein
MHTKHAVLIVAFALAPFAVVQAQQPSPGQGAPSTTQTKSGMAGSQAKAGAIASADRDFIMKAAAGGHTEVELAKLAQTKASSDTVKTLAARLEKDHTQANSDLMAIAQSKGVSLPAANDHPAEMAKLEKLQGANFDRTYASMMVNSHKNGIALFEKAAKSSDSEIKAFADKTLPTLREHLKMTEQAAAGTAGTSGTSKSGPSGSSGMDKPNTSKPDASSPYNPPSASAPK